MKSKNLMVLMVCVVALVFALQNVSASITNTAFGNISHIEVNGVDATNGGVSFAGFTGGKIPVLVQFTAKDVASRVKVEAWFSGDRNKGAESRVFDILAANVSYTEVLYLDAPTNLGEDLQQPRVLEIVVDSTDKGTLASADVSLSIQRQAYDLGILNVNTPAQVKAGDNLYVDIVLKNKGTQQAIDNLVTVSIPTLNAQTRSYFGDLSPMDQSHPDRLDAVERRAYVQIPANTPTGLYDVVIVADNGDSTISATKRIFVTGAEQNSRVIPSVTSQTFSMSTQGQYKLTVVNKGDSIAIYHVAVDAPKGLTVDAGDSLVVIPAGTSKTITVTANAAEAGDYDFDVKVLSEDGSVVSDNKLHATVEKSSGFSGGTSTGNATVLLTVILAIVFVVLLVVLIVLLTRKPEKTEEFGESYY